jgi:hypothetical protein
MVRILRRGKTRQILDLFDQGVRPPVIALEVEVHRVHVYRVLRAHGRYTRGLKTMRVSTVAQEDLAWLRREARRVGARWQDLARAMLTDAIQEARDGKD